MYKEKFLINMKKKYRLKWKYILVILPILFGNILFDVYPNAQVFWLSLYDWNPLSTTKEFIGFQNFYILFDAKSEEFVPRLLCTLYYVLFLLVIQTVLSMILTLALRKNTRFNTFLRAYFFLPMVFSSTMVALTWTFMYDPNLGVINNFLGKLGIDGFPGYDFFANNIVAILMIVLVHIWGAIGYPMLMLLSGLTNVSDELIEAAKIDGANKMQIFWNVEFPLILPTVLRMMLTTISTGAMSVDLIYMIGGSFGTTYDTWASWMYRETLVGTNYGMISAGGVLLFFVLATASAIQFVSMNKVEKKLFG